MKRILFLAALLLAQGLALAADWSKPVTTDPYATSLATTKARDVDLALGFDPAYTAATNISTNTIRWTGADRKWQLWNGTAWVDLATTYAISADSLNAANSYTVTGLTVSGGTANGVAYLNGSKALSSGSALTFDGGSLTVASGGTTNPRIGARYNNSNSRLGIGIANVNAYPYIGYNVNDSVGTDTQTYDLTQEATQLRLDNGRFVFSAAPSGTAGSTVTWSELARLTSTGFGIGVTPAYKLHVSASVADILAVLINSDTVNGNGLYIRGGGTAAGKYALLVENASGAPLVHVSASGNFGLGVTPSAWSGAVGLQIGVTGTFGGSLGESVFVASNAYYGAGWKYTTTNPATLYSQGSGAHLWYTAPSGTAGNPVTFTLAAHLDSTGLTTTLNTATTATTQVQNDNSTKVATTAYSDRPASETAAGRVELATVAEAVTGTDTARAVTPAGVKAAIDANVLGVGQTWTDVTTTPGRTSGTVYTNSTGKPIEVNCMINTSAGGSYTIGGLTQTLAASNTQVPISFTVPNGVSYSITSSISKWLELR